MFRVSAHQVGARTVSVLSIASSLAADSGGCYSVFPHGAPLTKYYCRELHVRAARV